MANTHFSGPVLYSGTNTAAPFAGMAEMPITINPAYFSIVDDFVGVAIDTTNDWTVVKDSGAVSFMSLYSRLNETLRRGGVLKMGLLLFILTMTTLTLWLF